MTKAVNDDIVITTIMFLPSPSFLRLGTSTPNGLIAFPALILLVFKPSLMEEVPKGADGGDGGRPASARANQKRNIVEKYASQIVEEIHSA